MLLYRQVELPLGATEDRICGTIDIERALTEGVRAYEPGLLVRITTNAVCVAHIQHCAYDTFPRRLVPIAAFCMWMRSTCWMTVWWTWCSIRPPVASTRYAAAMSAWQLKLYHDHITHMSVVGSMVVFPSPCFTPGTKSEAFVHPHTHRWSVKASASSTLPSLS